MSIVCFMQINEKQKALVSNLIFINLIARNLADKLSCVIVVLYFIAANPRYNIELAQCRIALRVRQS